LLRLYYLLFINYKHNVTIKKLNNNLTSLLGAPLVPIVPIKSYSNAEADKDIILKENQNKSGIYM
jgi:hypothetical protein